MIKIFRLGVIALLGVSIASCFHNSDDAVNLSGTITANPGSATDTDVNDPNAPYTSNNSPLQAQSLPNPVTVGGFVTVPGGVTVGRFANSSTGDVDDYYSLTLLEGQTVTLTIGDPDANNHEDGIGAALSNVLYLNLLDSNQNQVDSTRNNGSDSVTAPSNGQYYLQVHAFVGASDYLLSAGVAVCQASVGALANNSDLNINQAFVPGEVIVKFNNTPARASAAITAASTVDSVGLVTKAGAPGRAMLLSLGDAGQRQQALAALNIRAANTITGNDNSTERKLETLEVVKALRARDDVEYARPNYIRRASAVPNDPEYSTRQWNLPLINLPAAWDLVPDSSDVIVAVIDSGILPGHPDLGAGRLVAGYDFIRDIKNAADGDGMDDDPTDPGSSTGFHGTHVAGIIGAEANNSTGMAGIAWNVRLMPLRVLGEEGGTDYDIEQAVRYAAGLPNDAETTAETNARVAAGQVADVINMSLGGPTGTTVAPEAYQLARQQGVIIVAAAGNEGSCAFSYPASLEGVVSVSAVDDNKGVTDYSNIGNTIDVAAPGGTYTNGVYSLWAETVLGSLQYSYAYERGTSMAAPHVAGVAALMKSYNPALTPELFDALLINGSLTEDLGDPGRDNYYGYGLIDAGLAVQAANMTVAELDPILMVSPVALQFGTDVDVMQFSITNDGGGNVGDLTVSLSGNLPAWLTITPDNVDQNTGLGTYVAQIDRGLLPLQPSAGTLVTIDYQATDAQNVVTTGSRDLPVLVYSQSFTADTGYLYVQLLPVNTLDEAFPLALRSVGVPVSGGQYRYTLSRVPKGRYVISAGSDLNNNDYLSDQPDAKGDYPFLGHPSIIDVGGSDIRGLDFTSGYNLYYSASRPVSK